MRILVTGGAGYVGSRLCKTLDEDGHQIFIFDNLSTGSKANVPDNARLFQGSILSLPQVDEAMARARPDIVYHLATSAGVRANLHSGLTHAQLGFIGSINVIESSVAHSVGKLIYASSGGTVYGEPEQNPVKEDAPTRPISAYGVSKLAVEKYLYHVRILHGFPSTILRFTNMYSAEMPAGVWAAVTFMDKLKAGEPPTLFGDGSSTRDYLHLSDAVEAFRVAVDDVDGETFNVGTGVQTRLSTLLALCQQITGTEHIKPEYAPPCVEEVYQIALDCTKIKESLGWEHTISVEDGLREAYERRYN